MPKGIYLHHPIYRGKLCATCGKALETTGPRHTYCSECRVIRKREQCRRATRKARERGYGYEPCPNCRQPKQLKAELCTKCRHAVISANPELHPGWKGGKTSKRGYISIRVNGHYVPEHRFVWEQSNKKKLPKGYHVHHLNGITADNRPENLVAVDSHKHEHGTLLRLAQKRIRELEQLHLPIS